jgi:hypothetical protein
MRSSFVEVKRVLAYRRCQANNSVGERRDTEKISQWR